MLKVPSCGSGTACPRWQDVSFGAERRGEEVGGALGSGRRKEVEFVGTWLDQEIQPADKETNTPFDGPVLEGGYSCSVVKPRG